VRSRLLSLVGKDRPKLRKLVVAEGTTFPSFADYQALYLDQSTGRLIPNTEIWSRGALEMRINALGCKGADLVSGRPVIACFGDSTTFCVGADSWPAHVDVPGYQVLNAGIEGADMEWVAAWYDELRDAVPFAAVVVYLGWHNLIYNRTDEAYWHEHLERYLGDHLTAYCTIGTPLTEAFRERGIEPLLNRGPTSASAEYFNFWADLDPAERLIPLLDAIGRYDRFVRDFARHNDAVLIDLHEFLRPQRYEDAPRDFFDVCHLRTDSYAKVGRFVGEELARSLPPASQAPSARMPRPPAEVEIVSIRRQLPEAEPEEDLRQNIYPLW
jgi:hypothetical protein